MNTFIILATFCGGALLVFSIHLLLTDICRTRGDDRVGAADTQTASSVVDLADTLDTPTSRVSSEEFTNLDQWNNTAKRQSPIVRLEHWICQSGLKIEPWILVGLSAALFLVTSVAGWVATHQWYLLPIASIPAVVPFAVIAVFGARRTRKLREQLPDALELMSRMLRAGQTIPQSLRGIADEFSEPISVEFGFCYEQQNLGLTTDAALQVMAQRTGLLELRILVVALTVHRKTGGNLSELLDKLSAVIRDRHRIQGQIRALTADGRMQAAILLGLPPFLMLVISVLNNEYITVLFQFPWVVAGMFAFELFGALWLRKIVTFDF